MNGLNIANLVGVGYNAYSQEKDRIAEKQQKQRLIKEQQQMAREENKRKQSQFELNMKKSNVQMQSMQLQLDSFRRKDEVSRLDNIFRGWIDTKGDPDVLNRAVQTNPDLKEYLGGGVNYRKLNEHDIENLRKEDGHNPLYLERNRDKYVAVEYIGEDGNLQTKYSNFDNVVKGYGFYSRDEQARAKLRSSGKMSDSERLMSILNKPEDQRTQGEQQWADYKMKKQVKETPMDKEARLRASIAKGEKLSPQDAEWLHIADSKHKKLQAEVGVDKAQTIKTIQDDIVPKLSKVGEFKDSDIKNFVAENALLPDAMGTKVAKTSLGKLTTSYTNMKDGNAFDKSQLQALATLQTLSKAPAPKNLPDVTNQLHMIKESNLIIDTAKTLKSSAGISGKIADYLKGKLGNRDWASYGIKEKEHITRLASLDTHTQLLVKSYLQQLSGSAASDSEVELLKKALIGGDAAVTDLIIARMGAFQDKLRTQLDGTARSWYENGIAPFHGAKLYNDLQKLERAEAPELQPATQAPTMLTKAIDAVSDDNKVVESVKNVATTAYDGLGKAVETTKDAVQNVATSDLSSDVYKEGYNSLKKAGEVLNNESSMDDIKSVYDEVVSSLSSVKGDKIKKQLEQAKSVLEEKLGIGSTKEQTPVDKAQTQSKPTTLEPDVYDDIASDVKEAYDAVTAGNKEAMQKSLDIAKLKYDNTTGVVRDKYARLIKVLEEKTK